MKPDTELIEAVKSRSLLLWQEGSFPMRGFAHAYGLRKGGEQAIVLVWLVDQGRGLSSHGDASPTPRWYDLNPATSRPTVLHDESADQQRVLPYERLERFAELWQLA